MCHANRYDGLTWCDTRVDWSADDDVGPAVVGDAAPPDSLGAVTCVDCLRRIVTYGELAARQLQVVGDLANRDRQEEP